MNIADVMKLAPVMPVLAIDDPLHAQPIARALVAGGLVTLEVTLRTPAALDVIAEMAKVEGAVVGAGTVVSSTQVEQVQKAGARFIVSPGLTAPLAQAAAAARIAFLPGVATATDIMRGLDLGLDHFKFFPAEANGGIMALKALCGPFGRVRFCPTGGITQQTARNWLAQPEVLCVGGSWLVAKARPNLAEIEDAARAAATLRQESAASGQD